jgi:hypothetical protein
MSSTSCELKTHIILCLSMNHFTVLIFWLPNSNA